MKTKLILLGSSFFILTGCMVAPVRGGGVQILPFLPALIELDVGQPYYEEGGYHYYYSNDRWQYSTSSHGPWAELPRSHWPRETRWRAHDQGRELGRDPGRELGRDQGRGQGRGQDQDKGRDHGRGQGRDKGGKDGDEDRRL